MPLEAAAANDLWVPVCTGRLAQEATEVVLQIARELSTARVADASLTGQGGIALFYAYLSLVSPRRGFDELARSHLEQAAETIARTESRHWLYGGFTGLAWTIEHLQACVPELMDDDDANQDVDDALLSILHTAPWPAEYDLICGLVGLGVYALERRRRPAARECLELVIVRLAELARRSGDEATWWTDAHGCHNLGMAHGVPGVLAFLAHACALEHLAGTARPLVDGGVRWLLRQRRAAGTSACFGRTAEAAEPARTAWCYGDPGIAAALLAAARATGNAATEQAAIDIAMHAVNRPVDETGVVDAGLCHGAAGLAHLYNRLFQATRLRQFGVAACLWVERTLALWRAEVARDEGFLNGACGVGLSLLAAVSTTEPKWDRVLLCSIPPRQ